ncbi:hypothetical protein ACWOEY_11115 [Enterococcus sulfureus]
MIDSLYSVALYDKGIRIDQLGIMNKQTAYFTADYNNMKRTEAELNGVWLVMKFGREVPDLDYKFPVNNENILT